MVAIGDPPINEAAARTTFAALSEARIPMARSDRQPVFQHLSQGRVALVQGPSPIRLSTAKYVTPQQLEQLKAIRESIVARRSEPDVSRPIATPQEPPDQVTIFADTFVAGPIAGEIRHEVLGPERQANVLSVRNVKEFADFSVFSMPLPPAAASEHVQRDHQPSKHVVELAHEMVDNGMDVFVGHSGHIMQGIEVYKGRPIFYSMGDLSVHRAGPTTPENLVAFVATSTYQDGVLQEYPDSPRRPGRRPITAGITTWCADDAFARSCRQDPRRFTEDSKSLWHRHRD